MQADEDHGTNLRFTRFIHHLNHVSGLTDTDLMCLIHAVHHISADRDPHILKSVLHNGKTPHYTFKLSKNIETDFLK